MNDKSMIKQYVVFGALLLIGVFILMGIDWGENKQAGTAGTQGAETYKTAKTTDSMINLSDLRSGGSSASIGQRRKANPNAGTPFASTATSTPFSAATSTPFAMNQPSINPFARAQDENYSNLPQASGQGAVPSMNQDIRINRAPDLPVMVVNKVKRNLAKESSKSKRAQNQKKPLISRRENDEKSANTPQQKDDPAEKKPENELSDVISNLQISGHVVNENGAFITDLPLTLKLTQATPEDKQRFAKRELKTQTNDQGFYAFVNLVEGDYQLCTVEAQGYSRVCQSPHAPHTAADFTLRSTANGRVFGVVKNAQGQGLEGVTVSATPNQRQRAVTDAKGEFNLPMSVNAGLGYQVYFSKKDYLRERVSAKGQEVLATKQMEVVLKKAVFSGFDVTGTVYAGGSPISGQTVSLYSPTVKASQALRGSSGPDGTFTIKYVQAADDYRLGVTTRGAYTFDATQYKALSVYDGTTFSLELQGTGTGSFSARVLKQDGSPLTGEQFTLYSGSGYVGRQISDESGLISYESVPAISTGSGLRISSSSTPKYSFSGIKLAPGEFKSGVELVVDRGHNNVDVTVIDEETQDIIAGARGVLIWSHNNNGVHSQTTRSVGKTSTVEAGLINFRELGGGEHRLQISKTGYQTYSEVFDVNQQAQVKRVKMVKK